MFKIHIWRLKIEIFLVCNYMNSKNSMCHVTLGTWTLLQTDILNLPAQSVQVNPGWHLSPILDFLQEYTFF